MMQALQATEEKTSSLWTDLAPLKPKKVTVFGSHADGTADEYSVMDLVIIEKLV